MSINKLVLEKDGLIVGNTQLVASGTGISVGGLSVTGQSSFTGNATFSGTTVFTSVYTPGSIVQSNSVYFTTPTSFSIPAGVSIYTDVPGLSVNITPRRASSKIYILTRIFGEFNPNQGVWEVIFAIKRNGQAINLPPQPGTLPIGHHMAALTHFSNDADSTPENVFFDMMDSPANTSVLTYTVGATSVGAYTYFVNRCVNAATSAGYERGTSSMTLFEIAQ